MQTQTVSAETPAQTGDPATATGRMAVMGRNGDTKFFWNAREWNEVEAAKAVFDLYKSKGFAAFKMDDKGDQGEQMNEFDPSAGSILFLVPLVGG